MSASTTVESIRAARGLKRVSRLAFSITILVISSTTPGPSRRASFLTVDSSGTRWSIATWQNRRRCSESETSLTSVS